MIGGGVDQHQRPLLAGTGTTVHDDHVGTRAVENMEELTNRVEDHIVTARKHGIGDPISVTVPLHQISQQRPQRPSRPDQRIRIRMTTRHRPTRRVRHHLLNPPGHHRRRQRHR